VKLPPDKLAALGVKPAPAPPPTPAKQPKPRKPPQSVLAAIAAFKAVWPQSFGAMKPLAVGIHRDVRAAMPELPATALGQAMRYHVGNPAYLSALAVPGAMRVDLDGSPVEPVSDIDREGAAQVLRHREAWREAKKAKTKAKAA
jgi:sRNA-binding protein